MAGYRYGVVRLRAYAKVNLGLRVLGQRSDGFHNISTCMQTVSLFDSLTVEVGPGRSRVDLRCNDPRLQGSSNLAWRAADLFLRAIGTPARVSIDLRKSIPVGAGLGGGSSDAAATLRTLAAMALRRPAEGLLKDLAAQLGSDVPFFLIGGTVAATGRGTRLQALEDRPQASLVIARVPVEVSTAWAYRTLSAERSTSDASTADKIGRQRSDIPEPASHSAGWGDLSGLSNDFESVVFSRFTRVADLKRRLLAAGARGALMTGSGSAVFGVFDSSQMARTAARALCKGKTSAWPACYVGRVASTAALEGWGAPEVSGGTVTGARAVVGSENRGN